MNRTQAQMKYIEAWEEHLNDFNRLMSCFEGDYSAFQDFKGRLEVAKNVMRKLIEEVSVNVRKVED